MCADGKRCLEAVIFDMDGVLVDSEEFICKAACLMFSEMGAEVRPDDFVDFVGMGENRYIGGVAEKYGLEVDIDSVKKRTYDIYLEIIKGQLRPLDGVFEFIEKCRVAGKKIAVASSADDRKVKGNLAEIGLDMTKFGAIICGEDVEHKKPSPDIFLLAAERIGVNPQNCLIVEDAVSGVAAAKLAGAKCLAITSSFSALELEKADFFAENLAGASDEVLEW